MMKQQKGIALLEVLIGSAIILLIFLGLVAGYNSFVTVSSRNTKQLQATFLMEEGVEALKSIRDRDGWSVISTLSIGSDHYLDFSGNVWNSTTTPEVTDGFYRSIVLENVFRDANGDIAVSGTLDDGTRKGSVGVSWFEKNATTTREVVFYITKLAE